MPNVILNKYECIFWEPLTSILVSRSVHQRRVYNILAFLPFFKLYRLYLSVCLCGAHFSTMKSTYYIQHTITFSCRFPRRLTYLNKRNDILYMFIGVLNRLLVMCQFARFKVILLNVAVFFFLFIVIFQL